MSHEAYISASRLAVRCGLVALLATGCRSGGSGNQELLERELRFQETELYRLRDEIDELQCQVDSARRENQSLKKELTTGDSGAAPQSRSTPRTTPRKAEPVFTPPSIDLPSSPDGGNSSPGRTWRSKPDTTPSELPSIDVEIPGVDTNSSSATPSSAGQMPEDLPQPDGASLEASPAGVQGARTARNRSATPVQSVAHQEPVAADQQIASVVLNPQLTGGRDRDGQAGDEALAVAFDPRNTAGQLVRPDGSVSIVVLDPAADGPAARVARWDFEADEAAKHFGAGGLAQGYYFELPWSGAPPTHSDLHVFVRIKSADGSKQIADQTIHIRPPTARGKQLAGGLRGLRPAPNANAAGLNGAPSDGTPLYGTQPHGTQPHGTQPSTRFFARLKPGGAKQNPANATVDGDGSMNISIPEADGQPVVDGELFDGSGAKVAKSPRLLDRTRLRGGPGYFDGSRLRSLTGRGAPTPTPAAGNETIIETGPASTEVIRDQVITSPEVASRLKSPQVTSSEPLLVPPRNVEEPVGMQPAEEETPAEPPPPRYARPVWKPYR